MGPYRVASGQCVFEGCMNAQAPNPQLPLCFTHQGEFAVAAEYERWVACHARGHVALAAKALVDWLERVKDEV